MHGYRKECAVKSQHEVNCGSEIDTDIQMEMQELDLSSFHYLSSPVNNNSKASTVQDRAIETCKKCKQLCEGLH